MSMSSFFSWLTQMLEHSSFTAPIAALIWGLLSMLLSPCHLACIPLMVAFVHGQGSAISRARAVALSSLFALGILTTIAVMGLLTAAAGRLMGDLGPYGHYGVALVCLIIGLHLLGVIPLPWSGPGTIACGRRGLGAALVLGLIFGTALGPCTFAFMAPILAVVLKVATVRPAFSLVLLAFFGLGHCLVIVAAGISTQALQRYLDWNQRSHRGAILRGVCGLLVLLAGFYLIHNAPAFS